MRTSHGLLTYCTNIHAGENWIDHFAALKQNIPGIKKRISASQSFGIGLRLSHEASLQLQEKSALNDFKDWLKKEDCYVFTMNGFPYGGFHRTKVKDQVHAPDWTTPERVAYTIRLFNILIMLLPDGMEGGISTSPLSYKYWHSGAPEQDVFEKTTKNILQVVEHLIRIKNDTGKLLHLDIEPEPDGLLGNGPEFFDWYDRYLLPLGTVYLQQQLGLTTEKATQAIKDHLQLCYDVCHFAVGYENHAAIVKELEEKKIKVGKIQISAALKAFIPEDQTKREKVIQAFRQFNESTYLHQVVARQVDGTLKQYPDLPEALNDAGNPSTKEWRSHFHVPLFVEDYGLLKSTQDDIRDVLSIQKQQPFTKHLEVETYTWEVIPDALKLPLSESIIREMEWVMSYLSNGVGR
ncbi:metabolite traffic protein EboE [Chryseolinea sp. H1M3-3]|uniref:metabolite traffic protein EboE n=1 Tax=Chryseolinea sp. H1M3-3 TaxID=3034144 RepID=UPI0023ED780E|nr:metabolite traffic protein EboE [Chryseolinea sp. H1M3-3]